MGFLFLLPLTLTDLPHGASRGIRTPDILRVMQTLYLAELWMLVPVTFGVFLIDVMIHLIRIVGIELAVEAAVGH
jgi:hypothetical protein